MVACICRYVRALSDLFFPRRCIVCHRRLNIDEKHICTHCLADMPLTYYSTLKYNKMSECFNHLIEEKEVFATALFFYNGDSGYSNITKELKYAGNILSGRFFSKMLGKDIVSFSLFRNVDMVIPVPLHWTRRWRRGYNQAEVIAKEIAASVSVPMYTDILVRSPRTKTQTKIEMTRKYENVKGAFSVNIENLKKHLKTITIHGSELHILLVDDVFTSGSTMCSCYKSLKIALNQIRPSNYRISIATLGFVCNV